MSHEKYQDCIDACLACATECEHCATECLHEDNVEKMTACIMLDRECALVCNAAAQLMSIGGKYADLLCNACAEICEACARECEKHEHDHCRKCAQACRECAEACRKMVRDMAMN